MPTVSFCCIFKNEEKNLPRWIDNAKKIANREGDEIIAVDTGSTDKSVEILRKAGIEPYFFEWVNDFSKAKNFALSKATGDWIIFLDCDEYFNDASVPLVRAVIEEQDPDKDTKVIESFMLNINEDDNDSLISQFIHWRIYRNIAELKYENPIHEALNYTGKDKIVVCRSNLVIMHTGYSEGLQRVKGKRNLEFLQKEIAENKDGEITTQQAYYMANTYAQLKDAEKTAYYSRIAVKGTDEELGFMTVRMYENLAQEEADKEGGGDFNKIIDILDRGLCRAPEHPDLMLDKALVIFRLRYFYDVENLCFKMLAKANDPELNNKYESRILAELHSVYGMLSNVMYHKGNVLESRRYALLAIKAKPQDRDLLLNLAKCFRDEELSIVKPVIDNVFPKPTAEDKDAFKKYFSDSPYTDTYLHYVKPAENSFECYMCKGMYTKVVKHAEKELLRLFKIAAYCREKYPNETIALTLTTPEKYLRGPKKPPKKDITLKELTDKFITLFSKIILACFSMDNDEFNLNKEILNILVSPTKDVISAGFGMPCRPVNFEDMERFYKEISPHAKKPALLKLANIVAGMPDMRDEFLIEVIKDLMLKKELQGAYNVALSLKEKGAAYNTLMGIIHFYAEDNLKAREFFLKGRALGGINRELKDYIKWTDPSNNIGIKL